DRERRPGQSEALLPREGDGLRNLVRDARDRVRAGGTGGNAVGRGAPERRDLVGREGNVADLHAVHEPRGVVPGVVREDGDALEVAVVRGVEREAAVERLPRVLLDLPAIDEAREGPGDEVHDQCDTVPLFVRDEAAVVAGDADATVGRL